MTQPLLPPFSATASDQTAFTVWLARALKSRHDDAVNEPLPDSLLALLPTPPSDR